MDFEVYHVVLIIVLGTIAYWVVVFMDGWRQDLAAKEADPTLRIVPNEKPPGTMRLVLEIDNRFSKAAMEQVELEIDGQPAESHPWWFPDITLPTRIEAAFLVRIPVNITDDGGARAVIRWIDLRDVRQEKAFELGISNTAE